VKRSELKRRTPIKSSSGPAKRGTVKRVNKRRRAERFTEAFGLKASWIRGLSCVVGATCKSECRVVGFRQLRVVIVKCVGVVDAAHTKSRGAGGDSTHLIPLCTAHHHEQHTRGVETFAAKYGLDLEKLATKYEADWQLWQSTNNKGSEE
jgi:hypothetical protein